MDGGYPLWQAGAVLSAVLAVIGAGLARWRAF
jgi:hypothetical protein